MTELQNQLKEKVLAEINAGHSYEALQYVQSFVARKKKHLGRKETSAMVFYGARLLVDNGAPADAGTLLAWFVEDGAGEDYTFHMEEKKALTETEIYCDLQRISDLLNGMPSTQSLPIVSRIYGPLHKAVLSIKATKKNTALWKRLDASEQIFATVFEETKDWLSAYKSVLRLQTSDISRAASILDKWSDEGFPTEKPLFFGRAILQLLAENKVPKAVEMLAASKKYIDAISANTVDASSAMAVYNLSMICTELVTMPERPRVDPQKIFTIVANLYVPFISRVDPKLIDLLEKVGVAYFGLRKSEEAPNPMAAMMQSMFAGASAGPQSQVQAPQGKGSNRPTPPPGMNMNDIMKMLALQGKGK
jgi:hypothetical protein